MEPRLNSPLLEARQPCFPELLDELFVEPSIPLLLLLLVFTQSVAGILVAVARDASEDGPEADRDSSAETPLTFQEASDVGD